MKKTKKRVFVKLLLWLIGLGIAVRVMLPIVGVHYINKFLPEYLNNDSHVGYFNAVFVRGLFSLGRVDIGQPKGFDDDVAISAREIFVDVDMTSVRKCSPLVIESVEIEKLTVNLASDAKGRFNMVELFASSTNEVDKAADEDDEADSSDSSFSVVVKNLHVKDFSLSYRDYTYMPALNIRLAEGELTLTNVVFDASQTNNHNLITTGILTAVMKQPGGLPDAYVGIALRSGVFGPWVPGVSGAVRICGIELVPINMVINVAARQALGGDNMDLYMDIAVASDILDCHAQAKTKSSILRFALVGTPDDPVIKRSTALLNLATRPGALASGVVRNVGNAGVSAAKGVGKTAYAAGRGGAKAVGKVGSGLFKVVKNTVTLNFKGARKGLKEGTVGAAAEVAHGVGNTAGAAVDGVSDTAKTSVGITKSDDWRDTSRARWVKLWAEAIEQVKAAPYPTADMN